MKISHAIVTRTEGTLDELLAMEGGLIPTPPSLAEVCAVIRNLRFIVEVTPELRGNGTAQRAAHEAGAILHAFGEG